MTPLEQIEEDDMRRLHPAFPLNADLIAAGDNGIVLTEEQHRILTSQLEGSTTIYSLPENRQRVEGNKPYLSMTNEEQATLTQAHDTLQFGIGLEETNADPERPNITDLIWPGDPPILMAICTGTRELACFGSVPRRNILGRKVKLLHDYLYQ